MNFHCLHRTAVDPKRNSWNDHFHAWTLSLHWNWSMLMMLLLRLCWDSILLLERLMHFVDHCQTRQICRTSMVVVLTSIGAVLLSEVLELEYLKKGKNYFFCSLLQWEIFKASYWVPLDIHKTEHHRTKNGPNPHRG